MKTLIATLSLIFSTSLFGHSDPVQLSPQQRHIVHKEMVKLQSHMDALLNSLSRGNWKDLSMRGDIISDGFLLKKNYPGYPKDFYMLAKSFRKKARQLASSAKKKQGAGVHGSYFHMVDACMRCHARFASHVFPELKGYFPPRKPPAIKYEIPEVWK